MTETPCPRCHAVAPCSCAERVLVYQAPHVTPVRQRKAVKVEPKPVEPKEPKP